MAAGTGTALVYHYSQSYAPYCGLANIEELLGRRGTIEDAADRNISRLRPSYELGLDEQAAPRAAVET